MSIFDRTMGMSPEEIERLKPFGFAPGLYSLSCCSNCKEGFTGDKRSWTCRTCAEEMAAAQALIAATQPTRQQKCAELAKKMFPAAEIEPSSCGQGVDVRIYDKPNETRSWYNFDPYEDHEACHALLAAMVSEDSEIDSDEIIFLSKLMKNYSYLWQPGKVEFNAGEVRSIIFRALIADPAIRAEAAWRSIQEAR